MRKRKYNSKIASMSDLDITKVVDDMGYTPMYITSGGEIISVWVEIKKRINYSK